MVTVTSSFAMPSASLTSKLWSSSLVPVSTGRPGFGVVCCLAVRLSSRSGVGDVSIFAWAPTNGRVDGSTCHSYLPDDGTTVVVSSPSATANASCGPSTHCGATLNGAAPTARVQYLLVIVSKDFDRCSVVPA